MNLDLTRIFVKVAQQGSFTKAAVLLELPKSTISKSIAKLEHEVGTKLIVRTTRSLSLTAAGRAFYDTSLEPIQILEEAQKSLIGNENLMTGLIRITAPEDLGTYVIAPMIAQLSLRYPNLNFELLYTDRVVDLVKDGFDFAVRIGKLSESSLKVKRVGDFFLVMVASAKYLAENAFGKDKIKHPRDLEKLDALGLSGPAFKKWKLKSTKETFIAHVQNKVSSNQMSCLLKLALAGGGIALVPYYLCKEEIESGKLIRVLPEWTSPGMSISIVSPLRASSSARLKMTTDQIVAALQEKLEL